MNDKWCVTKELNAGSAYSMSTWSLNALKWFLTRRLLIGVDRSVSYKAFSISSTPLTATSSRALDSCPGGLLCDLFSSQCLLHMLQDVYRKQSRNAGGAFFADQNNRSDYT